MDNLEQLEALCEMLYNSLDSAERAYAENTLKCFSQDTSCIPQLEYILENARNPYAVLFASSSLLKHVTQNMLPLQLQLQIRNHVVNYLASRSANLEHFVATSLIQLVCRVSKLGWFVDDKFQELISDSLNFLNQQEAAHYAMGLKVLNQLVSEMNRPTPGLPLLLHRRVVSKFKDKALRQIYGISLTSLHGLKSDAQQKLQELALSLSLQCLSFDFMGSSIDESSDESFIIEAPVSWRSVLEEPSTVQIYFDYYAVTSPPLSKLALECLGRLTLVKRSLFTSGTTRKLFLTSLMMGSKDIIETGKGLNHHDNYHELCRFLGRFKVNFQLSEVVSVEFYNSWIGLISDFTLKSLQSWKWTSSSIYYLLELWSKMVTSLPYLKDKSTNYRLDEFVPKILEGFVSSRFDSVQAGFSDDLLEDPLDKVELMQDQLKFFPYLFRFQCESCITYLINAMDPLLQEYMDGTKLQEYVTSSTVVLTETKLAWMVHIVGAILSVKQYTGCTSNEVIDADLSARVLQLINFMDTGSYVQRYGELSRQRLELAVLSFFENFRKSYVGGQSLHAAKASACSAVCSVV
uniref:Importin N-terminal domain-containing protein n=1 Tax=Chenopodium quinoa TaxID=63459 RepID=A0A803LZU9_CHEQI